MNDVRGNILNETIIDLQNCEDNVHHKDVTGLSINAMVELIKIFESKLGGIMLEFVKSRKIIALPSIGALRIKSGRERFTAAYNALLDEFNTESPDDLSLENRLEFEKRVEQIKIEVKGFSKPTHIRESQQVINNVVLKNVNK